MGLSMLFSSFCPWNKAKKRKDMQAEEGPNITFGDTLKIECFLVHLHDLEGKLSFYITFRI